MATGLAMSIGMIPVAIGKVGVYPVLEWLDWITLIVPTLVTLLILTFPQGALPSHRWRSIVALAGVPTVALMFVFAFAKRDVVVDENVMVPNPLHARALAPGTILEGPATFLIGLFAVAVVVNVVVRYRRSTGLERQQFRWLAAAAVVAPLLLLVAITSPSDVVTILGFVLALNLIPGAIGIAVLRYRLYEIDRLISRTVSYAMVIGVLTAVFLGTVTLFTFVLPADSALAVAGSTLAIAALFNPVRRWVLRHVDRWFNRSRYDSQHVSDRFAERIRDSTETRQLASALTVCVVDTLRPSRVGIWVADSMG